MNRPYVQLRLLPVSQVSYSYAFEGELSMEFLDHGFQMISMFLLLNSSFCSTFVARSLSRLCMSRTFGQNLDR